MFYWGFLLLDFLKIYKSNCLIVSILYIYILYLRNKGSATKLEFDEPIT